MIRKECIGRTKSSKVKVEENGKSAVFLNQNRGLVLRIRVDGCVIQNALAADWLVSKPNVVSVVVELKGKDVNHAAEQVLAAASHFRKEKWPGKLAGLIVCAQYPKASTSVQKKQSEFFKMFESKLLVFTNNRQYEFTMFTE